MKVATTATVAYQEDNCRGGMQNMNIWAGTNYIKYPLVSVIKCLYFVDLTSFKRLGQKSLKRFRWFFGRKDDTKKTFWNYLTFSTLLLISSCLRIMTLASISRSSGTIYLESVSWYSSGLFFFSCWKFNFWYPWLA